MTQRIKIIQTCATCPIRKPPAASGVSICGKSGRNFREHVDAGQCPASLFVGGVVMNAPYPIPDDTTPEMELAKAKRGGCCGAPARE